MDHPRRPPTAPVPRRLLVVAVVATVLTLGLLALWLTETIPFAVMIVGVAVVTVAELAVFQVTRRRQ